MNDSSSGVGFALNNTSYAVGIGDGRRKEAIKALRSSTHRPEMRGAEEAMLHLGRASVTCEDEDEHHHHHSHSHNTDSHDHNSQLPSFRADTARASARNRLFQGGASPSAAVRPSSSLVSGGGVVVGSHGSKEIKAYKAPKNMSISAMHRNESMADHLAGAGSHAAEERLRLHRAAEGGVDVDVHKVGETTTFAMPKASLKYGCALKTQWLDPLNNPIPPSKTYSHYHEKMRTINMPHISYDIDGDGIVGPEDLFMAKRFDIDNNGVLDEEEQFIGKQIIAEQFFNAHTPRGDLNLFDEAYLLKSKEQNIKDLASLQGMHFKKMITSLKNTEKLLQTSGSQNMQSALTVWNPELIKHNYFTNKFDATAWNDFGAPGPRDPMFHMQTNHGGSLETLKNLRKNKDRFYCQDRMEIAKHHQLLKHPWMTCSFHGDRAPPATQGKGMNVARSAYMTNVRIENTVRVPE